MIYTPAPIPVHEPGPLNEVDTTISVQQWSLDDGALGSEATYYIGSQNYLG